MFQKYAMKYAIALLNVAISVVVSAIMRAMEDKQKAEMTHAAAVASMVEAASDAIDDVAPSVPALVRPFLPMLKNPIVLSQIADSVLDAADDAIAYGIAEGKKALSAANKDNK